MKQTTVNITPTKYGRKIKIMLGSVGVVAVIILAFTFRIELGILAFGTGGVLLGKAIQSGYDKYRASDLLYRGDKADVDIKEQEVEQAKIITGQMALAGLIHETKIGIFIFPYYGKDAVPEYFPATASERKAAGLITAPVETQAPMPSLINLIRHETQLCFFGARGSGKTNNALHWIATYPGDALIIDVKGRNLNLWPEKFEVVSEIREIPGALQKFANELENHRRQGVIRPSRKLLFVDELKNLKIIHKIDTMPDIMNTTYLGREYGFDSSFTTYGTTVKHLDIDAASLLDNFMVVKTLKDGFRAFVIGYDGNETEYKSPPAHPKPQTQSKALLSKTDLFRIDVKSGMSQNKLLAKYVGSKNPDNVKKLRGMFEKAQLEWKWS